MTDIISGNVKKMISVHILIIEDHHKKAEYEEIAEYIHNNKFESKLYESHEEVKKAITKKELMLDKFDIIISDNNTSKDPYSEDGIWWARDLRQNGIKHPPIILYSRSDLGEHIKTLQNVYFVEKPNGRALVKIMKEILSGHVPEIKH